MEYLLLEDLEKEKMITLGRGNIISKIDINAIPGNYPIYSSSATGNGEFGRYGKYMFEDERVTWSIDGGGRPFYREKHKYSVTNVCGWLKINTDKLITKFVYYCILFQWNMLKFDYIYKAHPSIIKEIYRIPMLPISIQKVIVEQLDKINNQISKNTNTLLYFEELTKSRFIEMFGEGEKQTYFKECVERMTKGPFGSAVKKDLYVPESDDAYKVYIQINCIQKNEALGDYYISNDYFENKLKSFEIKAKDYLFTCDGTLGKYIRLSENPRKGIISASLLRVQIKEDIITPEYFETMWDMDLLDRLKGQVRNGCLTHLPSAKVIGDELIYLPSYVKQVDFSKFKQQIDKSKFIIQKQIKLLEELLEKKMDEYFG